jgi:outer membrane protein insertion porin family
MIHSLELGFGLVHEFLNMVKTKLIVAAVAVFAVLAPGRHAAAAQTGGQAWKLAAISVKGSQKFLESQIIAACGLKLGDAVTQADLQVANDRLGRTGAFAKVGYQYAVRAGAVTVTYQVTDTQRFFPVRFTNFVWMPEDRLLAELRSRVPLFPGDVSPSGEMVESIERALEAILKERGITATADSLPLQERVGGPVGAMVFTVHGPSLPVREVDFTGNAAVSSVQLARAVQPLLGKDYDQIFAADFIRNVASPLYLAQGYLRASIGAPQPALVNGNDAGGPVALTVTVNEGLQYSLGQVSWSGNSAFSSDDLGSHVTLPRNRPANALQLQRDLLDVEKLYGTRGYLAAHVQSRADFDDSSRTVNYTLVVNEGAQYHMGQLAVSGVDADVAERLERDSKLRSGDPFNLAYWSGFMKENSRDLPPSPRGWKAQIKTAIHQDSKTVDVSIIVSPTRP